jgi:hypothetical protein
MISDSAHDALSRPFLGSASRLSRNCFGAAYQRGYRAAHARWWRRALCHEAALAVMRRLVHEQPDATLAE